MSEEAQDLIHVVAGVIWWQKRILLARRSENKHLAGFWEFPGGKIEPGEGAAEALQREINEEFAIMISVGSFLGAETFQYPDRRIKLHAYHATVSTSCGAGDSHDEVAWVTPDVLNNYKIAPADAFIVALLQKESSLLSDC